MRTVLVSLFLFLSFINSFSQEKNYVILIHGGAGNFNSKDFPPELTQQYNDFFSDLLSFSDSCAASGTAAIDLVMQIIVKMENNPLFNAGKGAVLNAEGKAELDASIMDGSNLNAGAVAGVSTVKNPIIAAYLVMTKSKHVLLSGKGADKFSAEQGLKAVKNKYFYTDKMLKNYKKYSSDKHGTVGCVVLDICGNIAAGTSTGGMMMKKWGRIGDSPVIGAGTYADSKYAGVSCTGHGEYFIRYAVAYDVIARMKYGNQTLKDAVHSVLFEVLKPQGGNGGIIAISADGEIVCEYNTTGMFRAWVTETHMQKIDF